MTVGKGGATRKYGVVPDIITIGKSIGGGTPFGAVGMCEDIAVRVAEGLFYLHFSLSFSLFSFPLATFPSFL